MTFKDIALKKEKTLLEAFEAVVQEIGISKATNIVESIQMPEEYLRKAGYKIKEEYPTKTGKELEFFKRSVIEPALEDLSLAGFLEHFTIYADGSSIFYEEL